MMNNAIYVYDVRTQMQEPAFVVYDRSDVGKVAATLGLDESHLFVTPDFLRPSGPTKRQSGKNDWKGQARSAKFQVEVQKKEIVKLKAEATSKDEQIATLNAQLSKVLSEVNVALQHVKRLQEDIERLQKQVNCTPPVVYNKMTRCS
jgi:septal ring factor EnvC (AmiA/AmiB activator)